MEVFEHSKQLPREETYSLTDQLRKSSRSVCSNFAEAWRKRRYQAAFVAKLSDAEGEAAETQVWLRFAVQCGYLGPAVGSSLHQEYDRLIGKIVMMINNPAPWLIRSKLN
jgi:four helix bundle protein